VFVWVSSSSSVVVNDDLSGVACTRRATPNINGRDLIAATDVAVWVAGSHQGGLVATDVTDRALDGTDLPSARRCEARCGRVTLLECEIGATTQATAA
jgi:hypothetical protein